MKNSIFQLWQTVEALTPAEAARIDAADPISPVYGLAIDSVMPWEDVTHQRKRIEAGWRWQYIAQCGIYCVDEVSRLLVSAASMPELPWQERLGARSRLFDLAMDSNGYPIAHTFALSLAAWASGLLIRERGDVESLLSGGVSRLEGLPVPGNTLPEVRSGYAGFDMLSMALMQLVADQVECMREEARPAGVAWLAQLAHEVAERLGIPLIAFDKRAPLRVRSVRVRVATQDIDSSAKPSAPDILTSFFVEDLSRAEAAFSTGKAGKGLSQFIAAGTGNFEVDRVDVRDEDCAEVVLDRMRPDRIPVGRWPSDHALVFSQQLAVNEAVSTLADDAGLFAVNGPPGTGKTTLLRDVVASVVTQRAMQMVKSRTRKFTDKQVFKLSGVSLPFYKMHECLQGSSIVVASSNNGAVENVSLELPGAQAVSQRVNPSYFPEIASRIIGKPAWGLIAAPLGKRSNRSEFLSRFWWGESRSADPDSEKAPGLRELLRSIQQGVLSPRISWDDAAAKFKEAVECEEQIRAKMLALSKLPEHVAHITLRRNSDQAALTHIEEQLYELESVSQALRVQSSLATKDLWAAAEAVNRAETAQKLHSLTKPGALAWMATLGLAAREWGERNQALLKESHAARQAAIAKQAALDAITSEMEQLNAHIEALTKRQNLLAEAIDAAEANLETHESKLRAAISELGSNWPMINVDPSQREHSSPWAHPAWLKAREEVFLAALDVHRAFIESHPTQMIANLGLASDWLNGKPMPHDLAKLALDSLCLVIPVISTTFASMPRMFASVGGQAIGWLLIDEAGQAAPSHAACAIWRARRTVIVGDPRQLEPVSTIPVEVEDMLAKTLKVEDGWLPSRVSAQSLADRSARLGTFIPDEAGEKIWVGCPLRLHRRCDEPMFTVSNTIAYGGMMVHGKPAGTPNNLPPSGWLDVQGVVAAGHWIVEEEACLRKLVAGILGIGAHANEIAMISPFRDCAQNLRRVAREMSVDGGKVGTVHTAQGKEADVVILVLGGDPRLPGAKAWAASKPNLLNVANSRAKKRLYVIGDRSLWQRQNYFSVLADSLPVLNTADINVCR